MLCDTKKALCTCCGKESSHPELLSGRSVGTDDLDLRPASPFGRYIGSGIQGCPHCGYAAEDISTPIPDKELCEKVIQSARYQTCDGLHLALGTAQEYYRAALLANARGDDFAVIQYLQRAIWCCDDSSKYAGDAAALRRITIPKIEKYLGTVLDDRDAYEDMLLVLVDFFRRLSRFDDVILLCTNEKCTTKPEYEAALKYQLDLANAKDNRRYDFASAFESYPVDPPQDEGGYKVSLADLLGSEYSVDSSMKEAPIYTPPFRSLSEAFEHESEPGFEDELDEFVSHMPYSRRTIYAIIDMLMKQHDYCIFYIQLLDRMDSMLTSEEIEIIGDLFNHGGRK